MRTERVSRWLPLAAVLLLLSAVVVGHVSKTFFVPYEVKQTSMNPGLVEGDTVLASTLPTFEYDTIVTTDAWAEDLYVKRLIGKPGDTIEFVDGQLYRNGEAIDEPQTIRDEDDTYTITLGEDEYWLLGDNRPRSADSRAFGAVHRTDITSQVWAQLTHTPMPEAPTRQAGHFTKG